MARLADRCEIRDAGRAEAVGGTKTGGGLRGRRLLDPRGTNHGPLKAHVHRWLFSGKTRSVLFIGAHSDMEPRAPELAEALNCRQRCQV